MKNRRKKHRTEMETGSVDLHWLPVGSRFLDGRPVRPEKNVENRSKSLVFRHLLSKFFVFSLFSKGFLKLINNMSISCFQQHIMYNSWNLISLYFVAILDSVCLFSNASPWRTTEFCVFKTMFYAGLLSLSHTSCICLNLAT